MPALSFAHDEAVTGLVRALDGFVDSASGLDNLALLDPSRCRGWSRLELVTHVRMGLQEMAAGAGCATDEPPDCDAATYWAAHPDDRDDDPVPHVLALRRVASAHQRPRSAVTLLRDVAAVAGTVVRRMPAGTVAFQGRRLASGDFLATWAVELAVHHLDLGLDPPHHGDEALAWTRRTLEALAGAELPSGLDDARAVLLGLGREVPEPSDSLDPAFPVSL